MISQDTLNAFSRIGITLTPAGEWYIDTKSNTKQPVDAHRLPNLSWDNYPQDNMGKHFLRKEQNLLVVDIDGEYIKLDTDGNIIVPNLHNLTLPRTFYTQTTAANKYHLYYKADTSTIGNRIIRLNETKIDVFTYGVIFEGHEFSPHHKLHPYPLVDAPRDLLENYNSNKTNSKPTTLTPTTNRQRAYLVNLYLNTGLETRKQKNAFFRSIIPKEYMPKHMKKLTIDNFKLSYDIMNKIAVKLTTTSELGYYEHVIPTINKLLITWGIDPNSQKSQSILSKNILPSLPQHSPMLPYNHNTDDKTLREHLDAQQDTDTPIFRTVHNSKLMYFEVDKITQEPIEHDSSVIIDKTVAVALHDERSIYSEDGKQVGWDDNLPILQLVNNPYKPQNYVDEQDQIVVNQYKPTQYIKEVQSDSSVPTTNIYYKTLSSTVGPQYLPLVLNYYAEVIFSQYSPTMVLWVAALESEKGGSGKSLVTLEILSHILGAAASGVDVKTITSGWGNTISQSRLLSLEDVPQMSAKEWSQVYAMIKQQNTNSYRKLNMKFGAINSERVQIALTGSSNFRPKLSPSDRRFLCLEPAWLHQQTEPLSAKDRDKIAKLVRSNKYEPELQEFTNYLYYLYQQPNSEEIETALYIEAPDTEYRQKWTQTSMSNSARIAFSLPKPQELHDMVKEPDQNLYNLYTLVVNAYNPDTQKTAVSWKWFKEFLPYVQSDRYAQQEYSKTNIAIMMDIDFTANVGTVYSKTWKENLPPHLPSEWTLWPAGGYVWSISQEAITEYIKLIQEHNNV